MKFSFTIIILICWSTLLTANDIQISLKFPNYENKFGHQCKDDIAVNFSNAVIPSIGQNFISSPLITCLNLTNIGIQSIQNGAFNKLPNLTQLFMSNNYIDVSDLFSFGSLENLKVLILNNATNDNAYYSDRFVVDIVEEYPNLEILSLHSNFINDLRTSKNESPFPKLKILDLSNNHIRNNNFSKLFSNTLYFLDLHDNSLTSLTFDKKQENLLALNLDNNNLIYIKYNDSSNLSDLYDQYNRRHKLDYNLDYTERSLYDYYGLAMTGLENVHYLSISENKIDFILSNAFNYTNNKLVYLNLSINNINYLHPNTFEKLQSLKLLDLSFNKFEDVPQISSEISVLSLNCNNIKNLIAYTFTQMPKLTELSLEGNQIVEINVKAFSELSFLELLDLSKNKLSFLPKGLSNSFTSLKYLNLNNNQFTSLESLSLTSALPLIEVYLAMNPLEYLDISYFKNLPKNLTVNLMQGSRFAYWNSNRCKSV